MLDRLLEIVVTSLNSLVPWVVLQPYERGVHLRLGHFIREVEPGFHWVIPFHVDTIFHENVVPRTERLSGLATTTSDGKSVGFDAVITYRITNITKALLEVNDLKDAIADSCAGTIGTTLAGATWEEIRHGDTVEKLSSDCRKRGWKWGVEIQNVQLTGIALVKNLRISTCAAPHATNMSTIQITN